MDEKTALALLPSFLITTLFSSFFFKSYTTMKSHTHTYKHTRTSSDSYKLLSEYHSIFRLTGLVKQYRGVSRVVAFNRTIALLLSRVIVLCSGADH